MDRVSSRLASVSDRRRVFSIIIVLMAFPSQGGIKLYRYQMQPPEKRQLRSSTFLHIHPHLPLLLLSVHRLSHKSHLIRGTSIDTEKVPKLALTEPTKPLPSTLIKRLVDHITLLLLQRDDPVLDRLLDQDTVDNDISFLA